MKDPFLLIQSIASEAWNEKKGLSYTPNKKEKERIIKRLEKLVQQMRELDFDAEIKFLKEFWDIK